MVEPFAASGPHVHELSTRVKREGRGGKEVEVPQLHDGREQGVVDGRGEAIVESGAQSGRRFQLDPGPRGRVSEQQQGHPDATGRCDGP